MTKNTERWYVETMNELTKDAVAAALQEKASEGPDERRDRDGDAHIVWECPFYLVDQLIRNGDPRLDFVVWKKVGDEPIRIWKFAIHHQKTPRAGSAPSFVIPPRNKMRNTGLRVR